MRSLVVMHRYTPELAAGAGTACRLAGHIHQFFKLAAFSLMTTMSFEIFIQLHNMAAPSDRTSLSKSVIILQNCRSITSCL